MTLARLWAFLAVGLPVLAALIANLSMVDLAYHLRAGGMTLDTGQIPTADSFTFTAPNADWLNQQWGAQVLLAGVYRLAGWTGLVVLRAALVGLTFGCLFAACRLRGLDVRRAAWLTLGGFIVAAVALALRPQLIGMALLAVTLLLLAARHAHRRAIWAVPVIVLVWANVHGSFFLGPAVVGLAWLEDLRAGVAKPHRTLLVALVSAAAALANPFGLAVWGYAAGLSTNSFVTNRITEWQPTTLRTVPGILFFGSAGLVGLLLARRGRPTAWPTLAWFAFFAAIGAYAIRGVAWWPLGAVVGTAGLLVSSEGRGAARRERSSPLNVAIVGLIVLVCVALLPVWRPIDRRVDAPSGVVGDAPAGVTAALRSMIKPGDRILNPQPWGSWFELSFPAATVAIDSRIELYPASVWDDYDAIRHGGEGWEALLSTWAPSVIVTTHDDTASVGRLEAAGWATVFSDEDGSILTHDGRRPAQP